MEGMLSVGPDYPGGLPVTRDFPGTGSYTVNLAGPLIPATVSLRATRDPPGARAR